MGAGSRSEFAMSVAWRRPMSAGTLQGSAGPAIGAAPREMAEITLKRPRKSRSL
jgi:hypothetical protein